MVLFFFLRYPFVVLFSLLIFSYIVNVTCVKVYLCLIFTLVVINRILSKVPLTINSKLHKHCNNFGMVWALGFIGTGKELK